MSAFPSLTPLNARLTPWQIFELPAGSSATQITKRYRSLALLHHPDKNPGNPVAENNFKIIRNAYEVLSKSSVPAIPEPATSTSEPSSTTASSNAVEYDKEDFLHDVFEKTEASLEHALRGLQTMKEMAWPEPDFRGNDPIEWRCWYSIFHMASPIFDRGLISEKMSEICSEIGALLISRHIPSRHIKKKDILEWAASYQNIKITQAVLDKLHREGGLQEILNKKNDFAPFDTPLSNAAKSGSLALVQLLVRYGAQTSYRLTSSEEGCAGSHGFSKTPIVAALKCAPIGILPSSPSRHLEIVKTIRDRTGYAPKVLDPLAITDSSSPLLADPYLSIITWLITEHKCKDLDAGVPLYTAIERQRFDIAAVLVQNGADVELAKEKLMREIQTNITHDVTSSSQKRIRYSFLIEENFKQFLSHVPRLTDDIDAPVGGAGSELVHRASSHSIGDTGWDKWCRAWIDKLDHPSSFAFSRFFTPDIVFALRQLLVQAPTVDIRQTALNLTVNALSYPEKWQGISSDLKNKLQGFSNALQIQGFTIISEADPRLSL